MSAADSTSDVNIGAELAPSAAPGAEGGPDDGPSVGVLAFISFTVLIGLLAQLTLLFDESTFPDTPWIGLALLAGLIVMAELLSVDIGGRSTTSVSVIGILAASFLYGVPGLIVTAAVFAIAGKIDSHSPPHRMFFNFGNMLVATSCSVWVLHRLADPSTAGDPFSQLILPSAAAGIVFCIAQDVQLCLVRGMDEQRNPLDIWRTDLHWLWPHYAVFGVLGMFLAVVYVTFGLAGVIALSAPAAMMQAVMRQYVSSSATLVGELQQVNWQLAESHDEILRTLSRALDTRDEETEDHSQRVRRFAELIARAHGRPEDEIDHLSRGALLHDIGKIGVPDAILLKPGKLTESEWVLVRKHPSIGYNPIADVPFLERAAEVVRYHHEAYNGSGYPFGIVGDAIPLNARIFAVADTLDAMTSDRPYRSALPLDAALAEVARCSGGQFDPSIVTTVLAIETSELEAARVMPTVHDTGMDISTALERPDCPTQDATLAGVPLPAA